MDIYSKYAGFIQEYIYRSGWKMLRAVQNAAGDIIFNTDHNLLLTASTASGKTEAAFFPILSLLDKNPSSSVGVLYIAPLKALINDQFSRLDELCKEAHIPVTKWHGDASHTKKIKLIKKPTGIIQITPESLEALMVTKSTEIPALFGDLRFVVIDEIHSLLQGDRGLQTFCLIERLCKLAGCNPRRIGLSATLGEPEEAAKFLSAGSNRKTDIPYLKKESEIWRLSIQYFYKSSKQGKVDEDIQYIFRNTRYKKCIIFTNSRQECERVCQNLRQCCKINHEPDRFLIHHGNLSKAYRDSAEYDMKNDNLVMSICSTSTLELGIDIGKLERAFQINAPLTVSSFLQRMGRTGRRNKPSEMRFVIREEQIDENAMLPEIIPWDLIQTIAIIQSYIDERFVEPPKKRRLPYSLLYHQTLSTLASCGEMTPRELASRVLTLSAFKHIRKEDYKILLRHLIDIEHVSVTENMGLILGVEGERIVNNYKFYAVFQDNIEYTVRSGSEEIGTIFRLPKIIGTVIAIAGKVWRVDEIDEKRHQMYCTQVEGKNVAYFRGNKGVIHTRILEKMYEVLVNNENYMYLTEASEQRLNQARNNFSKAQIKNHPLINLGEKKWVLFPWLGDEGFWSLERFLNVKCAKRLGLTGMVATSPYYMEFSMKVSEYEFYKIITEEIRKKIDPMELVYEDEIFIREKYDEYVPKELLSKGFVYGVLEIEQMKEKILKWEKQFIK